jgi:hypothetical protein
MKFADVHGDWDFDPVICSALPDVKDEVPNLVLIDFAFAPKHLSKNSTPYQPDVSYLRMILAHRG